MKEKKELLLTLEFIPEVGGVATYLSGLFRNFPIGSLKILAPISGDIHYPHQVLREDFFYKRFWPRWLKIFFKLMELNRHEKISRLYISHVLPLGYVAYLLKIICRIPYVIFFHGLDVRFAGANRWKKYWTRNIINRAEAVIANSEYTKKEILKIIVPRYRAIEVIAPSPKFFGNMALRDKELLIISVARLVPRKGLDIALKSFAKIKEQIPEIKYFIVGDGPERGLLYSLIDSLSLKESVRLLGAVPDATLSELYGRASLFLFPVREFSDDVEGFGIAPLEASAHGVPVVASKIGGVEEAVNDGVTGILVPPGNVDALTEASIFILKNPALAKAMSEAGIKWGAKFNSEAQTQKLRSIVWN